MKRLFASCGLLCFLVCGSFGQADTASDATETIKALMQEVQELKTEVAELRSAQAKLAEALSAQQKKVEPETAKPAEAHSIQEPPAQEGVRQPAEFSVPQGIKIQGFGQASYKATDARPPETAFFGFRHGANNSFGVGDLDLFVTSQLTEKTMVLSEIDFRETSDQVFDVNVERLLLKENFNDYFRVSVGRFHTSTSYYNSVFHHGDWLETAADRPLSVEFSSNGGLLPTQAVGVSVTGKIPTGALGLNYLLEYGTSDTIRPNILEPDAAAIDEGNGNGTTAGLFIKPHGVPGLEIGGSFYHDRLSPTQVSSGGGEGGGEGEAAVHIGQSIVSAHAVYVTPRFEFLNEAFLIQHNVQETGEQFNTPAFYSLISQKFGRRWRPFVRYQYANASAESPIFPDIGLRQSRSAGVRFDYNDYVAFKVQYDRTSRRQLSTINDAIIQFAFRF